MFRITDLPPRVRARRTRGARFLAALIIGALAGALASGMHYAALSARTLARSSAAASAFMPGETPAPNTLSPSPASASAASAEPPAPQALGAGTPLPIPVLASCSNPDLPPAILGASVPKPARALIVITAKTPKALLKLAVASTPDDRELGLMCVTALHPRAGMIFVFPRAAAWDFWMKDTLVPLDMVWADETGIVTNVAVHVPESTLATPDDRVERRNGSGRYVIELPADECAIDGIVRGTRIKLPPLRAKQ